MTPKGNPTRKVTFQAGRACLEIMTPALSTGKWCKLKRITHGRLVNGGRYSNLNFLILSKMIEFDIISLTQTFLPQ